VIGYMAVMGAIGSARFRGFAAEMETRLLGIADRPGAVFATGMDAAG